ncbi:hypothetical protein ACFOSV_13390 [Algoriphagus namhaensis]|uniref:Uncharacterized protein n=1 Tax=Algoriphagus namhaensis TaxID=915353 RepID=A0ABV8AW63_9BACT
MSDVFDQYKNAHKWMLLPWIVIIIGFTPQYFMTWLSEPWAYHLHAISALAWYALIIIQPYLATHGKLKQHRFWGIIGIFIAGAVVFSALSIVPTNVYFGAKGGFPPIIPASFFYGLAFTESIQVLGFGIAVIMAIINSKKHDDHAIWMTATVFFGLMPGWARLIFFPVLFTGGEVEWLTLQTTLNIGISTFLIVILYIGYRLKKLTHPAIILSLLLVFLMVFTITIGEQEWYQELITKIMKPTVPWVL